MASSQEDDDGRSAGNRLLVHDLTVLPRGERVPLAFTARNVAEDVAARGELIAKTGRMAVPVIVVDDEVIVGFLQ